MKLHEFLSELHRAYRPRSYLEIGVASGKSLALSRARTIGVDPDFKITSEIRCDVELARATSDEFFAREDALAHLPDCRIDLAFVDGLHRFEFALRDFMNVERHASWTSVIVIDDVLPRNVAEASRERGGRVAWAGDVFKLLEVLAGCRPDLLLLALDTEPTGVLVVLGADPRSKLLAESYNEIVAEYVKPDPQRVSEAVLRREAALDPASLAHSNVWSVLRDARESGVGREAGWDAVRRAVEAAKQPGRIREVTPDELQPRQRSRPPAPGGRRPRTIRRRALHGVRRGLRALRRRVRA